MFTLYPFRFSVSALKDSTAWIFSLILVVVVLSDAKVGKENITAHRFPFHREPKLSSLFCLHYLLPEKSASAPPGVSPPGSPASLSWFLVSTLKAALATTH